MLLKHDYFIIGPSALSPRMKGHPVWPSLMSQLATRGRRAYHDDTSFYNKTNFSTRPIGFKAVSKGRVPQRTLCMGMPFWIALTTYEKMAAKRVLLFIRDRNFETIRDALCTRLLCLFTPSRWHINRLNISFQSWDISDRNFLLYSFFVIYNLRQLPIPT